MRVGVISDIHGNAVALDAVLADLGRAQVDRIVCLGDLAATGPRPREVIERVRVGCPMSIGGTATGDDGRRVRPPSG